MVLGCSIPSEVRVLLKGKRFELQKNNERLNPPKGASRWLLAIGHNNILKLERMEEQNS